MSPQHGTEIKKQTPRRLFSLEILKSSDSTQVGQQQPSNDSAKNNKTHGLTQAPESASPQVPYKTQCLSSASSLMSFPSHPASIVSNTTSTSASTLVSVPPRLPPCSQTPKPGSRLAFAAKLGFKQVVDHAREAAMDENKKISGRSKGILGCTIWGGRGWGSCVDGTALRDEVSEQQSSGPGSPYTHTFNSTSGLMTASASTSHLASASGGAAQYTNQAPASGLVAGLQDVVIDFAVGRFASLITGGGDDISTKLEEERSLALGAFEVLVKTWPPANEPASAKQCLWCTKEQQRTYHLHNPAVGSLVFLGSLDC
ncbi:hypothetical protein P691DRAFT_780127 [Macrolepiota fuliginosa MF-IS2]|uniref:Uncharacterized protein n=1 Tax=Macrolepiota fuliginosa MF-IS2 TaxID=1400762 RepID=A0A9P5WWR5_9AGAR|nr:hypothetical protein P691DRAFT_780127 [Macrolepiota fuliginosa MF-IS2]